MATEVERMGAESNRAYKDAVARRTAARIQEKLGRMEQGEHTRAHVYQSSTGATKATKKTATQVGTIRSKAAKGSDNGIRYAKPKAKKR